MTEVYRKWFWVLTAPALLLYALVVVVPFAAGVLYSFTAWRGTYFAGGGNAFSAFVGLENYRKAFASAEFRAAFGNSVEFTVLTAAASVLGGLALALLTQHSGRAAGFFRAGFFLPNLLGGLALGYIWSFVFETVFGIVFGEGALDIPFFRNMLQSRHRAILAMAIVAAWQMAGYLMMIFVTGLASVPQELFEAAAIDGCGTWTRFRHVTLPLLVPSFTISVFLALANCFKMLDINVALTEGRFNTRLLAYQILRATRDASPPDYGLAQAEAVIFFVLIALITLTQVALTKRREVSL